MTGFAVWTNTDGTQSLALLIPDPISKEEVVWHLDEAYAPRELELLLVLCQEPVWIDRKPE